MPFIPNLDCELRSLSTPDVYGQASLGPVRKARCAIVRLDLQTEETSVRADSSASRGGAEERIAAARLLIERHESVANGDQIRVLGKTLRVVSVWPRTDIAGRLDHYQVDAEIWA